MESLTATMVGFRISDNMFIAKVLLHTAQQDVQDRDKEEGSQAEYKELDGERPEAPTGKRRKIPSMKDLQAWALRRKSAPHSELSPKVT